MKVSRVISMAMIVIMVIGTLCGCGGTGTSKVKKIGLISEANGDSASQNKGVELTLVVASNQTSQDNPYHFGLETFKEVMEEIKFNANSTVEVAAEAEEIVSKQTETVQDTIKVFGNMNDYLEGLISELAYLERTIESMESHRNNTLSAIESISAVSEQTAASISVVNESLKNQITMVGNLHNSTIELENRARDLMDSVNAFKLS